MHAHVLADASDLPTDPGLDLLEGNEPFVDPIAVLTRTVPDDRCPHGPPALEITQVWGDAVLGARRFPDRRRPVRIGPFEADFAAPMIDGTFELVSRDGDRWVLHARRGWDGFADLGGKRFNSLDALADGGFATRTGDGFDVRLATSMRIAVDIGGMAFVVQVISPGRAADADLVGQIDWKFVAIAVAVAAVFLVGAVLVAASPASAATDVVPDQQDYVAEIMMQHPDQPAPAPAGKAAGPEGKAGKPDATRRRAKGDSKLTKSQQRRAEVDNGGVLGAFRDLGLDAILATSVPTGPGGGWIGGTAGEPGDQKGVFGRGDRGDHLFGGAEGIDDVGTHGGNCTGPDCGRGGPGIGGHHDGELAGLSGDPIVIGSLDRSLIDAVIRKNLPAIRYCYQRELQKNPGLGGKITMKFVIAKDGSVASADVKSSIPDGSVGSCIAGRFMRFEFPAPEHGIVVVSYPFLFAPG